MKVFKLRVYANRDMATIVWMTDAAIPGCRGFAIERDILGVQDHDPYSRNGFRSLGFYQ